MQVLDPAWVGATGTADRSDDLTEASCGGYVGTTAVRSSPRPISTGLTTHRCGGCRREVGVGTTAHYSARASEFPASPLLPRYDARMVNATG